MSQARLTTVVLPNPQVRIVDGRYRFTGKAVPVDAEGGVLDYLRAAGVYDSKADAKSTYFFWHGAYDAKEIPERVDKVLAVIDGEKMKKDLEEKGYAFLKPKKTYGFFVFEKNKDGKEYFVNDTDRVTEGLIFQKMPSEFKLGYGVRHLTAQEAIELAASDEKFKEMATDYHINTSEVIQRTAEEKFTAYRMKGEELGLEETGTDTMAPVESASVDLRLKYGGGFGASCPSSSHGGLNVVAVKKTQ